MCAVFIRFIPWDSQVFSENPVNPVRLRKNKMQLYQTNISPSSARMESTTHHDATSGRAGSSLQSLPEYKCSDDSLDRFLGSLKTRHASMITKLAERWYEKKKKGNTNVIHRNHG
jgi:hypothetical protein